MFSSLHHIHSSNSDTSCQGSISCFHEDSEMKDKGLQAVIEDIRIISECCSYIRQQFFCRQFVDGKKRQLWTISSSLPLLPTTSVENFPEPHNRSQLRPLKNNLLSPQHRSFVSDSGIVGSLHSSSCRLSSEYHGSSLSLQMRHPPVATQSPKVGLYAFI